MSNLEKSKPVALVTGAAARIGRAIVEGLAQEGFSVAIHCNQSLDKGRELARIVNDAGGKACVVTADLRDVSAFDALMEDVSSKLGPVTLLVNNASVFHDDALSQIGEQAWEDHFALHLQAPLALTRSMVRVLPKDEEGLVVNMIDQRVWRLNPRFFSYTLSKSALWTATRTLAQELAPRVRVNAIGPGPTLPNPRQTESDFQKQVEPLLLKRGPDLSEFPDTISWLWRARSVTGQMIALDGGQHLAWETPDALAE